MEIKLYFVCWGYVRFWVLVTGMSWFIPDGFYLHAWIIVK